MQEPRFGDEDAQRVAALASYDTAAIAASGLLDDIVALAAVICGQDWGFVNLIDDGSQFCVVAAGAELLDRTHRRISFCGHVVVSGDLVEVADTLLDERFRDNPFVTSGPRIRFYAGVPITSPEGLALGALCVISPTPGALDGRQRDQLRRLGRIVSTIFSSQRQQGRASDESFAALSLTQRNYEMLARTNESIILAQTRAELFQRICDLTHDFGISKAACISWRKTAQGTLGSLSVEACSGFSADGVRRPSFHLDDAQGCARSVAVRSLLLDRSLIGVESSGAAVAGLSRTEAAEATVAVAAFPLRSGRQVVGIYEVIDASVEHFDEPTYRLLQEIADNVSLFLDRERVETERLQAIQMLQLQQAAMASSRDGIVIADARAPDMPLVYVNPAFEQISGYTAAESLGRNCRFLQAAHTEQPGLIEVRALLTERRAGEAVVRNVRKDGSEFWNSLRIAPVLDAAGVITHFVGSQTDVSERIRAEQELRHRATHDALTDLPNRELLEDRLEHAIAKACRSDALIGVALLDLDNFKMFNDSIGHAAGDTVLKVVAQRLMHCVRIGDTVARLSGDEFAIVFEQLDDEATLSELGERILAALSVPVALAEKEYVSSASVGLAFFPRDGRSSSELIKHADFAMYKAKEDGRGVIRLYQPDFDARNVERLDMGWALRQALVHQEFVVHYQPKVDAQTGRVCGAEALVRWQHPVRGMVPPVQFIELAEQTGVIVQLGEWVLREVCRQNKVWRDAGISDFSVAVNVSSIQFKQDDFLSVVRRALDDTGLDPRGLSLEITESVMMSDPVRFTQTLHDLKSMGLSISLDDFGTGYSSLSYLKLFPIDQLKIDRSFVRDITDDPAAAAICGAIIAMAHHLRMQVVAEGVETERQTEYLRDQGCDEFQGYLFSKPLPASALEQWLVARQITA